MEDQSTRTPAALLLAAALGVAACGGGGDEQVGADRRGEASMEEVPAEATATSATTDSAAYWAHRLMQALGGGDAWERTRFFRFRWIVSREGKTVADRYHAWDRYTGRYRLEYDEKDGDHVLALFDVDAMKSDSVEAAGDVWVGGEKLQGAARDSALRSAYGAFINDSYWLLHPFKLGDPGVQLEYQGRRELSGGRRYPTIHVTFEPELGVTTDEYWSFIDPETGLLHAWQYHLEGREEKGPVIRWKKWSRHGPIRLAERRVWPDGSAHIRFEELEASTSVPEGVFSRESR